MTIGRSAETDYQNAVAEVKTSENKYLNDLLQLREHLPSIENMDGRSGTTNLYNKINRMLDAVNSLKQAFPDGMDGMLKQQRDGSFAIDANKYSNYIAMADKIVQEAVLIAKSKASEKVFAQDCKQARSKGLITEKQEQSFRQLLLAPAQRMPRYALLVQEVINTGEKTNKDTSSFEDALRAVKAQLEKFSSAKSFEPLTNFEFASKVTELNKLARSLSLTSSAKKEYLTNLKMIEKSLGKNDFNKTAQYLNKISRIADKSREKMHSRKATRASHDKIFELSRHLGKDAEQRINKQPLSRTANDAYARIEAKIKSTNADNFQELKNQSAKREMTKTEKTVAEPEPKRTKLGR